MADTALLSRRLASFRSARPAGARRASPIHSLDLAHRLAEALDAEVVTGRMGTVVRREPLARMVSLDRERLAFLPGHPPPQAPLLCLDTETTGLATAAGTVAFLVGVGWWDRDAFRQVQLLLPDHPAEPALLEALAALVPRNGWLVTYNGRGFDWPLLVTRFRMARRDAPMTAGHLDLLPVVRQLFRHRLPDARLRTVETELLDLQRHGDVDGWEIPSRYLDFLRSGSATGLVDVVRHNEHDVHALALLLAHLEHHLARPEQRARAPVGDLAGLARALCRAGRPADALDCLDGALREPAAPEPPRRPRAEITRPSRPWTTWLTTRAPAGDNLTPLRAERARLLRRLGRVEEALAAWEAVAGAGGSLGVVAWVEVAKIREHVLRDYRGALEAVERAARLAERSRVLGGPTERPRPSLRMFGRPVGCGAVELTHRRRRLLRRASSVGLLPSAEHDGRNRSAANGLGHPTLNGFP